MKNIILNKSILQAKTSQQDHLHQHAIIPTISSLVSKTNTGGNVAHYEAWSMLQPACTGL